MTQQAIINKTLQLVAIQSTAHNKSGLQQAFDFVTALLTPHPAVTIERFASNGVPSLLAYYGAVRPHRFNVILNAHIDVVPGKPQQFEPFINGNRLYGRGVYDMKMAALLMIDAFLKAGDNPPYAIGLQITCDEEVGGYNGVAHQLQQDVAADFVITGEMTNLKICNEARGLCWVEVAFKGKSSHGGYSWEGKNAIVAASEFIHALLAKYPEPTTRQWSTTASVAAVTTGNFTYNIVPDDATVKIDFRFTPEDTQFKDRTSVQALIASLDPKATISDIPVFEPAVSVEAANPYLRQLMNAYTKIMNHNATLSRRYAGSDGRHFALYNIPSIEFGLTGANHHGEHEYVELDSVEPYRKMLTTFLRQPLPLVKIGRAPTA